MAHGRALGLLDGRMACELDQHSKVRRFPVGGQVRGQVTANMRFKMVK